MRRERARRSRCSAHPPVCDRPDLGAEQRDRLAGWEEDPTARVPSPPGCPVPLPHVRPDRDLIVGSFRRPGRSGPAARTERSVCPLPRPSPSARCARARGGRQGGANATRTTGGRGLTWSTHRAHTSTEALVFSLPGEPILPLVVESGGAHDRDRDERQERRALSSLRTRRLCGQSILYLFTSLGGSDALGGQTRSAVRRARRSDAPGGSDALGGEQADGPISAS